MAKTLGEDYPVFALKGEEAEELKYDLMHEMDEVDTDIHGRKYTMVSQFLENDDFYQGLNKVTVIRNVETGRYYGYGWWDDISKHGEAYIEPNGEDYGLECDTSADDFDWDNDYVYYYVFAPVEEYFISAFKFIESDS